jgi:GPH family glycoside/pentoside/hexuronide:cation symporter
MVVKYGKKELSVIGSLCSVVACIAMIVLPITPDAKGLIIYVLCLFISSLGLGIYSTVSWAMMGDAIDYNEWKNGVREEGVTYSLHSFFRKLAQGIGPAIALVVMVALGYVEANEGSQTFEVALRMRYLVAGLYTFSAILMYVGLGLIYNLDKKKLTKMNEELDSARSKMETE